MVHKKIITPYEQYEASKDKAELALFVQQNVVSLDNFITRILKGNHNHSIKVKEPRK